MPYHKGQPIIAWEDNITYKGRVVRVELFAKRVEVNIPGRTYTKFFTINNTRFDYDIFRKDLIDLL